MVDPSPVVNELVFDHPPDCIAFLPNSPDKFVVGTYFLEESDTQHADSRPQQRKGQLVLCQISQNSLIKLASTDTEGGAYDIHFELASSEQPRLLGVATSTGLLSIYAVNELGFSLHRQYRMADQEVLITSFAWHPTFPGVVALSNSTGDVVVCGLDASHALDPAERQHAVEVNPIWSFIVSTHSEAAWHVAWSSSGNYLLHGGDDAILGCARIPSTFHDPAVHNGPDAIEHLENKRIHGAGITAVLPLSDDWLLTGSYDDRLRVIHMVNDTSKSVAEMKFDDGVFRLKVLQHFGSLDSDGVYSVWILASCMRAGTRILKLDRQPHPVDRYTWSISEAAACTANESLNYASAYSEGDIVSVSFYDRKAFLWHWDEESFQAWPPES